MGEDTIHATCVVFCGRGILIRGVAGAGKSDLALRLMDAGGVLVADDRTILHEENGLLFASVPEAIAGLLEIRGIGLRRVPHLAKARIDICVECVASGEVERMPKAAQARFMGVDVPLYRLCALESSAVAKIRAVLQYPPAHD